MTAKYFIESFTDVQVLYEQARKCHDTVLVFDSKRSCANAKSILGLMSLSYIDPVEISCESESFFSTLPFKEI